MKIKKGFTILEILIVISIVILLSASSLITSSNYNRMKNDIDLIMSENMILGIINDGKQYCRKKQKPGFVFFNIINNEVSFKCDGKKIDSFTLPEGIKINSINMKLSKIDINKNGIACDAGTITLRDNKNNLYSITVNVGVGYAEIK
ncbi:prepilin-type N-terminal cleavage/methylation domain-containing protein [Clostridium sp. SYSU_GA19001]|uniref:prepilin-type N-terminal cleavage/methylation domain-containing protein n=1 Tax=Clostridium caldaquaticum TaxID=2940653 RepID=UPI002076F853|nr:prepilin-type N-terminal cleavage/methylation domain-containing protein [Clostridium caldaquaticum]MCM8711027.1 prepilin-type N-terminal cleavage/methylation domain-containing protein [Clostridium caldaquaticum]